MSVEIIDLSSFPDAIIQETTADFLKQTDYKALRIVQYDNNLRIIAVSLFKNGVPYSIPNDAVMYIRWGKKDHTYVRNLVLGCNEDRNVIYFKITRNMVTGYGPHTPILELIIDGESAGSTYLYFDVERNPIQDSDIESDVDDDYIEELVEEFLEQMFFEVGAPGQTTPSSNLMVNGVFFKNIGDSYEVYQKTTDAGAISKVALDAETVKGVDILTAVEDNADAIDDILNGTSIDSFADVEDALNTKQDILSGSTSIDITSNVVSVKQSYVDSQFLTDSEMNALIEEVYGSEYTL